MMKTYTKALHITDEDFRISFRLENSNIDVTTRGGPEGEMVKTRKWSIEARGAIQHSDDRLRKDFELNFQDPMIDGETVILIAEYRGESFAGPVVVYNIETETLPMFPPGDKVTIEFVQCGAAIVEPDIHPAFTTP